MLEVGDISAPPVEYVDDIVVLGAAPDVIEAVSPWLADFGVLAVVVSGTYEDWAETAAELLLATAVVLLIAGFVTDVATSERRWRTSGSWAATVSIVVLVLGSASYFFTFGPMKPLGTPAPPEP